MAMKRLLVLTVMLMLLCGTASADTLKTDMTEAEMTAIWQASFDKMGTYGDVNQSGELPEKGMMTYEHALDVARQSIFDKYGTPAEELDAMGVYPDYYLETWHLYFSPLTDGDVDRDPVYYAAPGAYRVYVDAWTGEVTYCNWYMDEFWDYAQRVWDNGSRDTVYGRAQGVDFFTQSRERQDYFRELMKDAGYDISVINNAPERILLRKTLDIMFADPATVIQPEEDEIIARAWAALEETYGLSTDLMRKYAYCATYSDLDTGTVDVFIAYNYEQEFLWQEDRISEWDCRLFSYANRLGNFMVQMDEATGEVMNVVHIYTDDGTDSGDKLMNKWRWTAEDLVIFDAAYTDYKQKMDAAAEEGKSREEMDMLHYELLRALGGDIGPYQAVTLAQEAAAREAGMTMEKFLEMWPESNVFYNRDGAYDVELWAGSGPVWQLQVSGRDGTILSVQKTDGVG